jgi:hypothetical protein
MANPRKFNLASVIRAGEYEIMTLVGKEFEGVEVFSWRCSCGAEAEEKWWMIRVGAAMGWVDHANQAHPGVW